MDGQEKSVVCAWCNDKDAQNCPICGPNVPLIFKACDCIECRELERLLGDNSQNKREH